MESAEAEDETKSTRNDGLIDQIDEPDVDFPCFFHPLCLTSAVVEP